MHFDHFIQLVRLYFILLHDLQHSCVTSASEQHTVHLYRKQLCAFQTTIFVINNSSL